MKKEIKIEKQVKPEINIQINGQEVNDDVSKEQIEALCKKKRIEENTEKHGPVMAKFVEEEREAETKQIKEKLDKEMKERMLTEKDVDTLKKMWEKSRIPLDEFSKRLEECLNEQADAKFFYAPYTKFDHRSNIDDKEMIERTKNFLDFVHGRENGQCTCKCQNENIDASKTPTKEEYVAPKCEAVEKLKSSVPGYFDGIVDELKDLHARKNSDYGNAAHESYKEFGLISYVIRLNDKMKRLKSLTKPGVEQKVTDEKIEDTLMDLAAYAIMAIESLRS